MNVRAGFVKTKPTSHAEVLRQPIFSNPLITNVASHPLGMNRLNEGQAIPRPIARELRTYGIGKTESG